MILRWSVHLSMTPTPDGQFTAAELARRIKELGKRGAQFICPQVKPGHVAGARLFDPNSCDCLLYEGRELTAWDRPPLSSPPPSKPDCRQDPGLRLGRNDRSKEAPNKTCKVGFSHKRNGCFIDNADVKDSYGSRTEVRACPNGKSCLQMSYVSFHNLITDEDGMLRRMCDRWYLALDPDSYRLTDDREGFGVYWCKAKGCRNYYRFNHSRLGPFLKDHTRACAF